jgi:hypothetical protein
VAVVDLVAVAEVVEGVRRRAVAMVLVAVVACGQRRQLPSSYAIGRLASIIAEKAGVRTLGVSRRASCGQR